MMKRRSIRRYRKLDALNRRLRAWGLQLERNSEEYLDQFTVDRQVGALFHRSLDGTGVLYVRSDETTYEVLHELAHILDYLKSPKKWVNPASTPALGDLLREQAAFNRFRNSRSWFRLTIDERRHAIEYIRRLGGDARIDLQTGNTVN
jgi:hypothetical protein